MASRRATKTALILGYPPELAPAAYSVLSRAGYKLCRAPTFGAAAYILSKAEPPPALVIVEAEKLTSKTLRIVMRMQATYQTFKAVILLTRGLIRNAAISAIGGPVEMIHVLGPWSPEDEIIATCSE